MFKGWVTKGPRKHLQGIKDDLVKVVLEEIEATMPKGCIARDQTKDNHGPWPRQSKVSLWFLHGTSVLMMIEVLQLEKRTW